MSSVGELLFDPEVCFVTHQAKLIHAAVNTPHNHLVEQAKDLDIKCERHDIYYALCIINAQYYVSKNQLALSLNHAIQVIKLFSICAPSRLTLAVHFIFNSPRLFDRIPKTSGMELMLRPG